MTTIDTGDTVFHRPSRETWLVAYVRGGRLCACGWPESLAALSDCLLVEKASPDERMELLREMADSRGNDSRIRYARAALAAEQPQPVAALTFDAFRFANIARCVKWHPAGIESWSPSDWLVAVTGELGELASLLKMRNRERDSLPGNKFAPTDKMIADELADVLTYLDLLAAVLGVDLGRAAVEKFNEVSERVGFPDRITLAAPPPPAEPSEAEVDAANAEFHRLLDPFSDELRDMTVAEFRTKVMRAALRAAAAARGR